MVVTFFCMRCGWKFDRSCALLGIHLHEANCATKKPKYIVMCRLCGIVSWDRILIENICWKKINPPKKRISSILFLSSPGVWWHWEVKTGGLFVAESIRRKEKKLNDFLKKIVHLFVKNRNKNIYLNEYNILCLIGKIKIVWKHI